MDTRIETAEATLAAMGFSAEQVEAATAALGGSDLAARESQALLTPRQLCERLGISATSLWRLQPPFMRVGARKRYVWSEVQRFLRGTQDRNGR